MTMLHTYLQKLLKMMFQKLKYLFLKTWLLIYFSVHKSFQKTMKYNELKVTNNARL